MKPRFSSDLDTPLIEFGEPEGKVTSWTIRDAVEGLQIFGGIGSGKTSGSGKMVALKFLQHGFGGLVLTVKPDEKALWQDYCRIAGREDDLIIVEPGGSHRFNFLQYESVANDGSTSLTTNIAQVLKTVLNASDELSNAKSNDPFWEAALDLLLYNTIDLCILAYNQVTVQMIYDVVQSIPKKGETNPKAKKATPFDAAYEKAQENIVKQIDEWEAKYKGFVDAEVKNGRNKSDLITEYIPDARTMKMVDTFFVDVYWGLSDKTRSIIDLSFSSFLFKLLKDPVYSLFCIHYASTFTPEASLDGKIILIDVNVKRYNEVGRDAQIMFKYVWQRAMEKRNVEVNGRPLFLWADEAQNFLHQYDATYQATARSSRIATVYISQNLPNYHASMGGNKSEFKVKSFLGTLATKILHANADIDTNNYASSIIGEAYQKEETESTAVSDGKTTVTTGISAKLAKMVRPEEFFSLKTGGPLNNGEVQGYVVLQGKTFANGFNHKKITFKQ